MLLEALFSLTAEGWLAFWVMMAVAAWMVRTLLGVNTLLRKEKQLLDQVSQFLGNYDPQQEGQLPWEDIEGVLGPQSQGSTVYTATQVVYQSVRFPASMEAALAPVLRRNFIPSVTRLLPNLFMLLGLFGTVWGLAGTLGSLAPQIERAAQATSPDQLARDLGSTIGAMQGAFGASLWGILLAVLASLALGFWNSRQSRFTAQLEELVLNQLVPAVLPPSIEEALESQVRALKSSGQLVRNFQEKFEETLTDFTSKVGVATETLSHNVEQISDLYQGIRGQLESSIKELGQAGNNLADTGNRLVAAQSTFSTQFEVATRDLSNQLTAQIRNIGDLQATVENGTQENLTRVSQVSGRLDRVAQILEQEGLRQQQQVAQLITSIDSRLERLERVLVRSAGQG